MKLFSRQLFPALLLLAFVAESSLAGEPDPEIGGGYFMLLAAAPPADTKDNGQPVVKRELTIVIDRSMLIGSFCLPTRTVMFLPAGMSTEKSKNCNSFVSSSVLSNPRSNGFHAHAIL